MVSDRTLRAVFRSGRFVALAGDLIRVGIAALVLFVAACLVIYYYAWTNYLNDFKVFYYAAQLFLAGGDMYGPSPATTVPVGSGAVHQLWNMNPPHFHLLLLPLARLPMAQARIAWAGLNLGALIVSLLVIARTLSLRWTLAGAIWTLLAVLSFSASGSIIATGQVAWLILVPLTLAWRSARQDRWMRAALWLGLAASLKPFLGVFLVYLFLKRGRGPALAMIGSAAACAGIGVAVFGWNQSIRWLETLRSVDWAWAAMNGSITGLLTRNFTANPFVRPVIEAPALVAPAAVVCSLALAWVSLRAVVRDASPDAVDRAFTLLILLALLVSPLGWVYYLWLIAGPAFALWRSSRARPSRGRTLLVWLAAPGLVWPLLAYALIEGARWAAPTLGSIYSWSMLALWGATLMDFSARGVTPAPNGVTSPAPGSRPGY